MMCLHNLTEKKLNEESTSSTSSISSITMDSTSSSSSLEEFPNTFEGPEKNLEIDFRASIGDPEGCRKFTRTQIDAMLDEAKCQILSKTSNEYLDAYVLSESSLFIYSHKIVIKTCGTTTLLKAIPLIQQYSSEIGMEIEWVSYSRKNYLFPEEQQYPHGSFDMEVAYLSEYFEDGTAYVLGPVTHDHWFLYVWDADSHLHEPESIPLTTQKQVERNERTVHLLMQNMHPDVAKLFFKCDDATATGKDMTKLSGIDQLVPGGVIDEFAFDPCGYSMNGIYKDAYYTIHITPESHCSYASFETNAKMSDYNDLVRHVLQIFRPAKFTMSLYKDADGQHELKDNFFLQKKFDLKTVGMYKRQGGYSQSYMEGDYRCFMANWSTQPTDLP